MEGVNSCDVGEQGLQGGAEVPDGGGGGSGNLVEGGEEDPSFYRLWG